MKKAEKPPTILFEFTNDGEVSLSVQQCEPFHLLVAIEQLSKALQESVIQGLEDKMKTPKFKNYDN